MHSALIRRSVILVKYNDFEDGIWYCNNCKGQDWECKADGASLASQESTTKCNAFIFLSLEMQDTVV